MVKDNMKKTNGKIKKFEFNFGLIMGAIEFPREKEKFSLM